MYGFVESDWKLFRKMLPIWQERFMLNVNEEIKDIISKDDIPSTKFWAVDELITKYKKHPGVMIQGRVSRSNLDTIMVDLVVNKVITKEDISEFSIEMKDYLEEFFN